MHRRSDSHRYASNHHPNLLVLSRRSSKRTKGPSRTATFVLALLLAALPSLLWTQIGTWIHPVLHAQDAQFQPPIVVVNEVAWGGTSGSYADEWIELYNTTYLTHSLVGWRLHTHDGDPDIVLTGTISPYGYFLIERTDDTTVSDIQADLIATFGRGLSNEGETLLLSNDQGIIVDTVNGDGGPWPNGDEGASPTYWSLERLRPTSPDLDDQWLSNNGSFITGSDCEGNPIRGTPRDINSIFLPTYRSHADLAVSKAGPSIAFPGTALTYAIQLRNVSGLTATEVSVIDLLPESLSFLSQDSDMTFSNENHILIWQSDMLPPGDAHQITFAAQVSGDISPGLALTNHVTTATSAPELSSHDNEAGWTVEIRSPAPDLRADKTGPAAIATNAPFTFYLGLTNTSPFPASSVVLTDRLPGTLQFLGQISSLDFHQAGQLLRWQVPTLAPAAGHRISVRVSLAMDIDTIHEITNRITVTSQMPDLDAADNSATWTVQVGKPEVLISGVLYDGYQLSDVDEAVEIANRGSVPADLIGWELCKMIDGDLACREVPQMILAPGDRVWLAREAEPFTRSFGKPPDFILAPWLSYGLANAGDELILRDPSCGAQGCMVDAVVYGSGALPPTGWHGAPVDSYYNYMRGEEGQILGRIWDEGSGRPIRDTDTAEDWLQVTTNVTEGRRVLYPGWDVAALFRPLSVTEAATVIVGVAPDNAFDVISETLMRAHSHITAELYTLRHPRLIEALAAKALEGVDVTLLLEGAPVGIGVDSTDWQTQLYGCQVIETAGGECWFMIHAPEDRIFNRYHYLHSKLLLVDDQWVALGTQNLTLGGMPSDEKANGTLGSRGVVLVTDAPSIVRRASQILALDLDPRNHADLLRWNTNYTERYGLPDGELVDLTITDEVSYTVQTPEPIAIAGTYDFELFTAPEAALRQSDALLGLIGRAGPGDTIRVEQMYERVAWGEDPIADPNLRLRAYVEAARRGASVRVLLNGRNFAEGASGDAEEGVETAAYLNALARREGMWLRASTGNPTFDGIHNKMMLVDLHSEGKYAHIGSINGSEAAHKVNREVAIQIASAEVHDYLAATFEFDWGQSNPTYLPLLLAGHSPPRPPVDHLVVSEVSYTGSAAGEWIEIYNPTDEAVDLSDHKLGDASSPQDYEPMFAFPANTIILSEGVLVIAVNAAEVPASDFEFYESDVDTPNMVPYLPWGSQAYPLALRDAGDQVVLLGPDDAPIDVVVWGDKEYPGVVPHPGVTTFNASLERQPSYYDTDDCAADFVERYPATPGEVPAPSP